MSPEEAIHQACLLRFRPIMMTTMAALLGGLPLALGTGTGSELRRPLGITIVGGLIISQVLTLYTTPVIYLYMDRLGRWLAGAASAGQPQPARPRGGRAMNISAPFIRRPIATSLLAAAILLAGHRRVLAAPGRAAAARRLPDHPGQRARCPARAPRRWRRRSRRRSSGASGASPGVTEMTSTSSLGSTPITLQFDLDRDVDAAARDVQAAINAAGGELPPNLPLGRPTARSTRPTRRS